MLELEKHSTEQKENTQSITAFIRNSKEAQLEFIDKTQISGCPSCC